MLLVHQSTCEIVCSSLSEVGVSQHNCCVCHTTMNEKVHRPKEVAAANNMLCLTNITASCHQQHHLQCRSNVKESDQPRAEPRLISTSVAITHLPFTRLHQLCMKSETSQDKCRSKAGWRLTSQGAHDGQLALQGSSAQGNASSDQHRLIRELLSACCTVFPQLRHRLIYVHDVNVACLGVPR